MYLKCRIATKKGLHPVDKPKSFCSTHWVLWSHGQAAFGGREICIIFYPGMMIEGAVETTVTSLKLLCLLGRIFVISAKTRALKTFARSRSRLQSLLVDSNTKSWWKCIETLIDVGWFGGLCRVILSSIDYRKFMCSGMIEFNTVFNSGAEGHAHGFRCGWLSCHPRLTFLPSHFELVPGRTVSAGDIWPRCKFEGQHAGYPFENQHGKLKTCHT